jgi:hypothetical protein
MRVGAYQSDQGGIVTGIAMSSRRLLRLPVITMNRRCFARRYESPLLRAALPNVMRTARSAGLDLQGTIVSLDGVYDCRRNRKAIFNRGMVPNINANPRGRKFA